MKAFLADRELWKARNPGYLEHDNYIQYLHHTTGKNSPNYLVDLMICQDHIRGI